jgi:hypothetical protein
MDRELAKRVQIPGYEGRYLCEVRAGQYWRLENLSLLTSF